MSGFKIRSEKNCLNCGKHVEELYCTHCGQENIELKENAFHIVTHTIADYFHFDSKFAKTLKPLLFNPGYLTTEYVKGKRAAYLHPIRLYIFISIVFFIFALSNSSSSKKASNKSNNNIGAQVLDSLQNEVGVKENNTIEAYLKKQTELPEEKRDGLIMQYFKKKEIELKDSENAQQHLISSLVSNVPKMMFVLLPLFAAILKLVYIRKNRYYYEHLVYSFHLHSALFISFLVFLVLNKVSGYFYDLSGLFSLILMIYVMWYSYRSLKTFYGGSRFKTFIKLVFLFFSYIILLTACLFGVIALSLIMV